MAYLENGIAGRALRAGQMGGSAGNNILDTVNLYQGSPAVPFLIVSLPGQDQLSVSLQASFAGTQELQAELNNRSSLSSVLGFGWRMPICRIAAGNRSVCESYQSDFYLTGEGGEYPLYRTGTDGEAVVFLSVEHPTWEFLFYNTAKPEDSYWEIRKEDGSAWIYGGTADSVETALCWDNWAGAAVNNGGVSWAAGWCLSAVKSYNGSCLHYEYENVKESLGDASYTRTMRLKKVQSTYGDWIELSYLPKEKEEYTPEHQRTYDSNAYQCQWEDAYLDEVCVRSSTGRFLYTQKFAYTLSTLTSEGGVKRLLESVIQISADGTAQPPMRFFYGSEADGCPGALTRMEYPFGEAVRYEYQRVEFPHSSGSDRISLPGEGWITRLVQGADFTVAVSQRQEETQLRILFWDMGWHTCQVEGFRGRVLQDVQVFPGQGFFAVLYYDSDQNSYAVFLVKRSPVRRFDWETQEHRLEMETECPAAACGKDFFAVQHGRQGLLEIAQFHYTDNAWHWNRLDQETGDFQALGAGDGCLLGAYYDSARMELQLKTFYADESHTWRMGEETRMGMEIELQLTKPGTVWSVGQGQASAAFVSLEKGEVCGTVVLLRWRTNFTLADTAAYKISQSCQTKNPILYTRTTDTIVGFAQNLYRYTPGNWNPCTLLLPSEGGEYVYAYGSDLALAVERLDGCQRFYALRFDPYRQGWTTEGVPFAEVIPDCGQLCVPVIQGNIAILGRNLFVRRPQECWEAVYEFPVNADLSTVQIAPDTGYLIFQSSDREETIQLSLLNQKPQDSFSLLNQSCRLDNSYMAGAFAFYTCTEPETSGELVLYAHYLGTDHKYRELQTSCVLSRTVLETGFSEQGYRMEYALDSARLENGVPAFAGVRVHPESGGRTYGYIEHTYFNGLDPASPLADYPDDSATNVKDFYSHMAGHLSSSRTYDADERPVTGAYSRWYAMDTLGYCIRERRTVKQTWLDGYDVSANMERGSGREVIEAVIETEYEPQYYLPRRIIKYGRGEERIVRSMTYAWEVYPKLQKAHLLDQVCASSMTEESSQELLEATANVWEQGDDGIWREASRWRYDGSGEPEFPFCVPQEDGEPEVKVISLRAGRKPEIQPGGLQEERRVAAPSAVPHAKGWQEAQFILPPAGWFPEVRVVARGEKGGILHSEEADGTHTFTIYDEESRFPVASFHGLAGVTPVYCGFEPYERLSGWTAAAGGELETLLDDQECYSGTRCLSLQPGTAVSCSTGLLDGRLSLLVACAVKTPKAQTKAGTITLLFEAGGQTRTEVRSFTPTGGLWQKQTFTVPACGLQAGERVTLRIQAPEDGVLLVDTVFFCAALCPGMAYVYDPDTLLQTAQHPSLGEGKLLHYDRRQRPVAASTDTGTFQSCSRYIEGSRVRKENQPDETLAVEMPQGGSLANFNRGWDFIKDWQTEGSWSCQRGILRLTGEATGALFWKDRAGEAFLLYLYLEEPCTDLTIDLDEVRIRYQGSAWELSVKEKQTDIHPAGKPPCGSCLLLFIHGRLQVTVEEEEIFVGTVEADGIERLQLTFQAGACLEALGFCPAPKLRLTCTDYIGRTLQDQAVTETGILTVQSLYDGMGQEAVRTKAVGQDHVLWGYRQEFVTGFDWETGLMSGEAADAYPEDQGYPYSRTLSLLCAAPRPRAFGQPGADWAIREQDPSKALVEQNQYADPEAFPACRIEMVREAGGKRTGTVYDVLDRKLAELELCPDGLARRTLCEYDSQGRLRKQIQPNAEQADSEAFTTVLTYDFLGYQASKQTPDGGTAYTAYDRQGRLRYSQSAGNRKDGCIVYHLYDSLGRETETGSYPGVWEADKMRQMAWQPGSEAPTGAKWKRRMEYDGDGTDPLLIGKLWKCHSNWDGVIVTDCFSYDAQGNQICHEQTAGDWKEAVRMEYDHSGHLIRQWFEPDTGSVLRYTYDMQGRMTAVYHGADCLCRYEYRPEGALCRETFAPDTDGRLERSYTYDSCQWLTKIEDRYFSQTLSYANTGGTNGRITEEENTFAASAEIPAEVAGLWQIHYSYDGFGRLTSAASSNTQSKNTAGMPQSTFTISYDANGNAIQMNGDSLRYQEGTNRLLERSGVTYTYSEDGETLALPEQGISSLRYDPVLSVLTGLEAKTGSCRYYYNGSNGAAACDSSNGRSYFLLDGNGQMISRVEPDGSRCLLVRGVNGIFAQIYKGKVYYLLKDQRSSVRGIYDGEKLCAVYQYETLGGMLAQAWEDPGLSGLIPLRFAGHLLEPCGLYRLRARWYDPVSGRYLGIDPASQYPSPYLYGGSDWINYVDPDGAFSFWSLLSLAAGCILAVGGIALSICTAGIASPVGAVFATLGAAAIAGAGMGAAIYGITSCITGDFNWKDCLVNAGAGALFGMIGCGIGAAIPAGFTIGSLSSAVSSYIVDIGSGILVGAADSIVTNGCLNVIHGKSFADGIACSALIGAAMGGILSGIGGLGHALRNVKALGSKASRTEVIGVGRGHEADKISHISMWRERKGGTVHEGTDHWPGRGRRTTIENLLDDAYLENEVDSYRRIKVPQEIYDRLHIPEATHVLDQPFNLITNNCTTYAVNNLAQAGLATPFWVRSPSILMLWTKLFTVWQ